MSSMLVTSADLLALATVSLMRCQSGCTIGPVDDVDELVLTHLSGEVDAVIHDANK